MKKFLPFVFPLVALIIVLFLAYRWYNTQTTRTGDISQSGEFAEGQKIDSVSQAQAKQMMNTSASDSKTVDLKPIDSNSTDMGQIRYELKDGKIYFTVNAALPEITEGMYQVWLKDLNSDAKRKVFVLEFTKGGYTGSAAISTDALPFEVVVSKETSAQGDMSQVLLRGIIQK